MPDNLDITYVPLTDLEPWPGNARRGVVSQIKESMRVNGVFNPLVVQKNTGRVMVGNHRMMALAELHEEDPDTWDGTAPVIYLDVNDHRANKINVADNKTSDDASWDEQALAAQLQTILEETGDLDGTGFDLDELEDLNHLADAAQWDNDNPFDHNPEVDDSGFWPKINLQVPPDVFDAWHTALNEHDGDDDAVKLAKFLRHTGHLS